MKSGFVTFGIVVLLVCSDAMAQPYLIENQSWEQNLVGVEFASSAWGDVNNDGRMDLALSGCTYYGGGGCTDFVAKIYINNGTSLVEDSVWGWNLTPINYGSSSWGDIDNDGDLDLISIGCDDGGGTSQLCQDGGYQSFVYINNGTSLVEDSVWDANLEKVWKGAVAISDIDNDGRLDVALTGVSINGKVSKIYINNGTSLVEDSVWGGVLIPLYESSAILCDVNNDYNIDLVICGDSGTSNELTNVYLNNGTSFIESSQWQQNLLDVDWCSLSSSDYDNDGDLDLALIGHTTQDNQRIYRNTGENFTEIQKEIGDLVGIFEGSMSFGDYDNDGYLDLIATGNEGYTTLYLFNMSRNKFTQSIEDPETNILNLEKGSSISFVDMDNDGDLDLSIFGYLEPVDQQARVYINNISLPNTLPTQPNSGFINEYNGSRLNLTWGTGLDAETPILGLYYNLRVGTCSGCHDVVSGVYGGSSNPTAGYFGNMMQRKSIALNRHFEPGTTIYWAVQTIDTGLAKSAWSTEQVYVIPGGESPCEPSWSCSSWGECQSSETQSCGSWVDANACNESYDGSNTQSCTYDEPDSPGGGSRPSGGSSVMLPEVKYTFDRIEPGVSAEKEVSDDVSISLRVKNAVSKVTLAVRNFGEKLASFKEAVRGKLYGYLEINSTGLTDDDIDEAYIEFRVNRSWIDENGVDPATVKLSRYENGNWTELETEMVGGEPSITGSFFRFVGMITGLAVGEDEYYTYRAKTPGFSYFAITGEEKDGVNENPSTDANVSVTDKPSGNGTGGEGRPSQFPLETAAVVAVIAAIAAIGVVVYMKKSGKPKTLEETLGTV